MSIRILAKLTRNLVVVSAVLAVLGVASTRQTEARNLRGTEVAVSISSAVVPSGFDRSDVVAVLSGVFSNSCYSWSRADVNHTDRFTHEIKGIAHVEQGACLTVLVPFSEEVHMGAFEAGHHTLRYVSGNGTYFEKTLDVE